MSNFWLVFTIIASAVVLTFLILLIVNLIVTRRKNNKMFNDVEVILSKIKEEKSGTLTRVAHTKNDNLPYEFRLEFDKTIYCIKVIPNYNQYEITINNSIKWQIRRSYTDESLNFVPGVEKFIRYDYEDKNVKNIKIFIIYPNAKSLLKYVNECEMEFVTPETDIYGTRVYTYDALVENIDIFGVK